MVLCQRENERLKFGIKQVDKGQEIMKLLFQALALCQSEGQRAIGFITSSQAKFDPYQFV